MAAFPLSLDFGSLRVENQAERSLGSCIASLLEPSSTALSSAASLLGRPQPTPKLLGEPLHCPASRCGGFPRSFFSSPLVLRGSLALSALIHVSPTGSIQSLTLRGASLQPHEQNDCLMWVGSDSSPVLPALEGPLTLPPAVCQSNSNLSASHVAQAVSSLSTDLPLHPSNLGALGNMGLKRRGWPEPPLLPSSLQHRASCLLSPHLLQGLCSLLPPSSDETLFVSVRCLLNYYACGLHILLLLVSSAPKTI